MPARRASTSWWKKADTSSFGLRTMEAAWIAKTSGQRFCDTALRRFESLPISSACRVSDFAEKRFLQSRRFRVFKSTQAQPTEKEQPCLRQADRSQSSSPQRDDAERRFR